MTSPNPIHSTFRPGLVPTAFAVFGVTLLLNLSAWQVRRHGEARAADALVQAQQALSPLGSLPEFGTDDHTFRRVALIGRFDEAHWFLQANQYFGGPGSHVWMPFRDASTGRTILVDRGWVPLGQEEEVAGRLPSDPSVLEGILFRPEAPASPSLLEGRTFRAADPAGMAAALPYPAEATWVVIAGQPVGPVDLRDPARPPVDGYRARLEHRPHLEYAGTWFLLAVVLVTVWVALGVRRARPGHV